MSRRQLKTTSHVWTSRVYSKFFGKNKPVPYDVSVQIIEQMHLEMYKSLIENRRPIMMKKSVGYLEFRKKRPYTNARFFSQTKGKPIKSANHHTCGYMFRINFQFSGYASFRIFKFVLLRRYKRELAKMIFEKDVQ